MKNRATVKHVKEEIVILKTDGDHEISLPIGFFIDQPVEGQVFHVELKTEEASAKSNEDLAKAILNEILDTEDIQQ